MKILLLSGSWYVIKCLFILGIFITGVFLFLFGVSNFKHSESAFDLWCCVFWTLLGLAVVSFSLGLVAQHLM